MGNEIYLDNAATTMVDLDAAALAMEVFTKQYGNPSSAHAKGLEAEHLLKKARLQVLSALGYKSGDGTLLFTSCGTEANNTAIFGVYKMLSKRKNNIVISDSEHPSVEKCVKELESLGVEVRRLSTKGGKIDTDEAKKYIDGKTMLISCMAVNNETGSIYDVKSLSAIRKVNAPDAILHVDGVQGFTKLPYKLSALGADLISVSGHKIHAPKGVGALFIKKGIHLPALLYGGGQEGGLRSGTENLASICAFGLCCEKASEKLSDNLAHFKELNFFARETIKSSCPNIIFNTPSEGFASNILSISLPGIRSEICLRHLSSKGIYVSAGSACSSKNADNRVLSAFGLEDKQADSTLRISFSKYTTKEEISLLAAALKEADESLVHTL